MTDAQAIAFYDEQVLGDLAVRAFENLGTPSGAAHTVVRSLIEADRLGHASHGVVRVLEYAAAIRAGHIHPAEQPTVATRFDAAAVVDGRWGWGHLAAGLAARTAAELAEKSGSGYVSVRRCNHSGRLGEWVEEIAGRGLIGIGMLSCGPAVAPLGARERVLGTNPIAVAIPADDRSDVVVMDFATAAAAEGKIRVAARHGKSIGEGLVQTVDGRPTTDPADFYAGGSILPFGAHKGYALSVIIQIIGEALTDSASDDENLARSNGLVLFAINPAVAGSWPEFRTRASATRARIRAAQPNDGAEILLPGDVERRHAAGLPAGQIAIDTALWADLEHLASAPGDGTARPVEDGVVADG